ncbi:MAG: nicotinate-nucleotide adenylyltransferase [bacterium]|nr:nicotinate-nucleotide adenylyltransferase [bacterium]MDT8395564.1 nicotinate-nucleotide adenylyltransferase [bacterium]
MKKIGIFGGTFDPVHNGHITVAGEFAEAFDLDRVFMMASANPPHRSATSATAGQRYEMLCLAVQQDPRLVSSDMEIRRRGLSYTLDTVEEISARHGSAIPWLALGADAFAEISTWYRPADVLARVHLVVLTRPGFDVDLTGPLPDKARHRYTPGKEGVFIHDAGGTLRALEVTPVDLSSSRIREMAARGEEIANLVPGPVFQYIQLNGIYRPETTAPG